MQRQAEEAPGNDLPLNKRQDMQLPFVHNRRSVEGPRPAELSPETSEQTISAKCFTTKDNDVNYQTPNQSMFNELLYVCFQYSRVFIRLTISFPLLVTMHNATNSSGQCICLQLHVILLVVLNITLAGPYLYKNFLLKHTGLVFFSSGAL